MASSSSTPPEFFALVHRNTLLNNKLIIPNKIVTKCGSSLGDDVLFKLPCGSEWKLGLTKTSEGTVFVDNGWIEFSKHYSIGMGHLLILSYDGNSRFNVLIFDITRNEIDYPLKNRNQRETKNRDKRVKEEAEAEEEESENGGDEDEEEEESEEKEEGENGGDEDGNNPFQPRKRMRKGRLNGGFRDLGGEGASPDSRSKAKRKGKTCTGNGTSPQANLDESDIALERASGFDSKHPFFVHVIRHINARNKYSLSVPSTFAQSYLGKSKRVVFRVEDRRTWLVEYRASTACRKHSLPRFATGWVSFAQENRLKNGDVCAFVMVKTVPRVTFDVTFLHKKGATNSASVQVPEQRTRCLQKSESVHAAKRKTSGFGGRLQSEKPSFAVYMLSSYTKRGYHLRIPASFARTYMARDQCEMRFCVLDGRSWSVQYKMFQGKRSHFEISKGWSAFKRESGLEEGDICMFELRNKAEMSFNVRIMKPTHKGYEQMRKHLQPSQAKPVRQKMHSKARTTPSAADAGKFRVVKSEVLDEFRSKNPYFRVDFPSSHCYVSLLHIPVTFSNYYLKKKKRQSVTLEVGDKSWPVKLLYSPPAEFNFSAGWIAFRKDNSLHSGDVCVFELIKSNEIVFKVSIFHKAC